MAAVHPFENFIRPRLHRQMQIGHQFRTVAVGLNQFICHVIWMAGGKAYPFKPLDIIEGPDQFGQCPTAAWTSPVIGVYILSQKGDFAHPARHQIARLGQDTVGGTAYFCATRIGHNAKCTEFITALLYGQKRTWRTFGLWASFKMFEFVLFRKISV